MDTHKCHKEQLQMTSFSWLSCCIDRKATACHYFVRLLSAIISKGALVVPAALCYLLWKRATEVALRDFSLIEIY